MLPRLIESVLGAFCLEVHVNSTQCITQREAVAARHPHPLAFADPAVALRPGMLLAGRYRIRGLIQARDWSLYQAKDIVSRKLVSIKQMPAPEGRREAHLLKRFHHPMIPSCHRVMVRGRAAYLVLDLIEGAPLLRWSNRWNGDIAPLRLEQVIRMGCQLADLLVYLHGQRSMVQVRAIGLANIWRAWDGKLKLVEFGQVRVGRPRLAPSLTPGALDVADARALLCKLLPSSTPDHLTKLIKESPGEESARELKSAFARCSQTLPISGWRWECLRRSRRVNGSN